MADIETLFKQLGSIQAVKKYLCDKDPKPCGRNCPKLLRWY